MKNNYSDEKFRHFPLYPEKIKQELPKETYNLTLSWLLENNPTVKTKIIDLQKEFVEILKDCENSPEGNKTYIYPHDNIHFSLLNFYSLDEVQNFSSTRLNFEKKYEELLNALEMEIKTQLKTTIQSSITFRWIYTGKFKYEKDYEKNSPGSIALQAYPNDNLLNSIIRIQSRSHKIFATNFLNFKPEIKGYPRNFAVNLFKLFINLNDNLTIELKKLIEEKNKAFDSEILCEQTNNIILSLVSSDSYLSNSDPEARPFFKLK